MKVGHTIVPIERPGFNHTGNLTGNWRQMSPQEPIETMDVSGKKFTQRPPYMMIGCHKRSDETVFKDFSYPGAKYDELTMWPRYLEVNRTHNEVLYSHT